MKTELLQAYSANSLVPPKQTTNPTFVRSFSDPGSESDSQIYNRRRDNRVSIISLSEVDLFQKERPENVVRKPHRKGVKDYIDDWTERTFKMKTLYKKVPFLSWIQTYNRRTFLADLITGFVIGLAVLPQALAIATIAGLPPQVGLYSGFVGPFVYIFFGTSKFMVIGPTAGMAMITLSAIEHNPPELAVLLAFITGIITLALGLLHLGFILNFLSVPVMSGFTSAMAIAICSTQLPALLGIEYVADGFVHMVQGTYEHIEEYKWADLVVGLTCIVVLLILQHLQGIVSHFIHPKKMSHDVDNLLWFISTARNVIVVLVTTGVFGCATDPPLIATIGDIEPGLPHFTSPPVWFHGNNTVTGEQIDFSMYYFLSRHRSAFLLFPLIALAEHLTIAKEVDGGDDRLDTTQEMICIGLSNLIGSFCGSMPVTGSFTRPNHMQQTSRDQSPLGGAITGILVILSLLFLTPYFEYIPRATIAAVIIAGILVTIDVGIICGMWRSKKMDLIPWSATFIIGLVINLEYGVLTGLGISVVFILYHAALPEIRVNMGQTSSGKKFVMVELDRSLIFPAVDYSQYALLKSGTHWARDKYPVVIDCSHIQFADYTAAHGIKQIVEKFHEKSQKLILWKMKPSVLRIVKGVFGSKEMEFQHCSTELELEALLGGFYVIVEDADDAEGSFEVKEENANDRF